MTPSEPLEEDVLGTGPDKAPPQGLSLLGHLAQKRDEIVQSSVLERRVPRWENPELWVKYKAIDHKILDRVRLANEKTKGPQQSTAVFMATIDALIAGCVGVCAKFPDDKELCDDDGEPYEFSLRAGDPEGVLTTFDPDLAENLGLSRQATARQVVQKLFITDGDVMQHANSLSRFSGYVMDEADDGLGGY